MSHPPWVRIATTTDDVRLDQLTDERIIAYDKKHGPRLRRRGYDHALTRSYIEDAYLVAATCGDREATVTMTQDHPVLTRWSTRPGVGMYLMRSHDDHWRVGIAWLHMDAQGYDFGPARRATAEQAAELWLLAVFPTEQEARVAERETSTRYGITESCFRRYRARLMLNGGQTGQEPEPLAVLRRYHRDIRAPFWRAGTRSQRGCRAAMQLTAANLIPGWMELPIDIGAPRPHWREFNVMHLHYTGPVFSVAVPKYEHYVADRVVVRGSTDA